jgi:hypothetical protein
VEIFLNLSKFLFIMKLLEFLKKQGILSFGVVKAKYKNAKDRPDEFQEGPDVE